MADELYRSALVRAQESTTAVRLARRIRGAEVVAGVVVDVGRSWVLLARVTELRQDGWTAIRVADVHRVQPMSAAPAVRRVAEADGTWPPTAPDGVDLSTTRALVETASSSGRLVHLEIERDDPDVCFIGIPAGWGRRWVDLQEVTPQAVWDGTVSRWRFRELTLISFGGAYERDLAVAAGPPPATPALVADE